MMGIGWLVFGKMNWRYRCGLLSGFLSGRHRTAAAYRPQSCAFSRSNSHGVCVPSLMISVLVRSPSRGSEMGLRTASVLKRLYAKKGQAWDFFVRHPLPPSIPQQLRTSVQRAGCCVICLLTLLFRPNPGLSTPQLIEVVRRVVFFWHAHDPVPVAYPSAIPADADGGGVRERKQVLGIPPDRLKVRSERIVRSSPAPRFAHAHTAGKQRCDRHGVDWIGRVHILESSCPRDSTGHQAACAIRLKGRPEEKESRHPHRRRR